MWKAEAGNQVTGEGDSNTFLYSMWQWRQREGDRPGTHFADGIVASLNRIGLKKKKKRVCLLLLFWLEQVCATNMKEGKDLAEIGNEE